LGPTQKVFGSEKVISVVISSGLFTAARVAPPAPWEWPAAAMWPVARLPLKTFPAVVASPAR